MYENHHLVETRQGVGLKSLLALGWWFLWLLYFEKDEGNKKWRKSRVAVMLVVMQAGKKAVMQAVMQVGVEVGVEAGVEFEVQVEVE